MEGEKSRSFLTTLQLTMTAINAALYAAIGLVTFFGIFAPQPLGIVRFWPAVVVPGVFATLFGPWVGGIGAAIGIFASDMLIHGNAFLSVTVGVPSNFIGFFLVGYIARKKLSLKKLLPGFITGALILIVGVYSIVAIPETRLLYEIQLSVVETILLFLGSVGVSYILIIIAAIVWREWRSYGVGSIIGLGAGSAIIGLGLAAYTGSPIYFSLGWFVWTFTTEIPFLLLLGPPILKACYRAFPNLKLSEKESK
jgi:hypothetical protein